MYFDRLDILEAWYLALSHCHSGQYSYNYKRLCGLRRWFSPSPMLSVDRLNDNAKEIYENACKRLLGES
jgi:predicted phosphohydrolase